MATHNEDTPFSSSTDYTKYTQYLVEFLRVQNGQVRDSYRYEYRYVGDLFLSDYLYDASGDLLPCFAEAEESQDAEKTDGRKKERGWCPVILCILHSSDDQYSLHDR